MKKSKSILQVSVIAVAATLGFQTLFAQPSGSITNLVTNPTNALWDFSLLTNELQNVDFTVSKKDVTAQFIYADPFTQNGAGKFSGSGSTTVALTVDGETPSFTGPYKVSGSVTSSKGVAKVTFMTKVSGTDVEVDGKSRSVSGSESEVVEVNAVTGLVTGRSSSHASASGLGSISSTSTISDTLASVAAEIGDGTWTLVLDFGTASGKSLSGTASVTLNAGTVYPFTFTGAFNSKTGDSKLNLKGTGTGVGSALIVTLNSSNTVSSISGKVSGQTVKQ
jgi:hypothetical protein